jgi:hypothetical protein
MRVSQIDESHVFNPNSQERRMKDGELVFATF